MVVMEELLRQRYHLENERRASSKTAKLAAKTASAQQQRLREENTELLEAGGSHIVHSHSFVRSFLPDDRPIFEVGSQPGGGCTKKHVERKAHGGGMSTGPPAG